MNDSFERWHAIFQDVDGHQWVSAGRRSLDDMMRFVPSLGATHVATLRTFLVDGNPHQEILGAIRDTPEDAT